MLAHYFAHAGADIAYERRQLVAALVGIAAGNGIKGEVSGHAALRHEGKGLRLVLRTNHRTALADDKGLLGNKHLFLLSAVIAIRNLLALCTTKDVIPICHVSLACYVLDAATLVADESLKLIASGYCERQLRLVNLHPCLCGNGEGTGLLEVGEGRILGCAVNLVHLILYV